MTAIHIASFALLSLVTFLVNFITEKVWFPWLFRRFLCYSPYTSAHLPLELPGSHEALVLLYNSLKLRQLVLLGVLVVPKGFQQFIF